MNKAAQPGQRLSTGGPELDTIINGGLIRYRLYLVEGTPGTGKTTLAMRFVMEGARRGEKTLYITLGETRKNWSRRRPAMAGNSTASTSTSWCRSKRSSTGNRPFCSRRRSSSAKRCSLSASAFPPLRRRLVINSLSELRLLARDPLRFRRQILALKSFLTGRSCTTLILDDLTTSPVGLQLHSIVHGVITLEQLHREFGAVRRRLRISKLRGSDFQSGYHDFLISGPVHGISEPDCRGASGRDTA